MKGCTDDPELTKAMTDAAVRMFGAKKIMRMSPAATAQRKAAAESRWQGRGTSATVRVDKDAAEELKKVPLADRRKVASDAVRSGVKTYLTLENIG